jgi:poly(hydroxyalkanoate) depolymerase family esterase
MKLRHKNLLFIILFFSAFVKAGEQPLQKGTFTNAAGSRDYYLYVPAKVSEKPALLVALHGCTQTAPDFAGQSGFTDLSDKYGFIAVFPEQNYKQNIFKCWNWFKPENQEKTGGEASIIVDLTKKIVREVNGDERRIYITGLSAGAALAANLFACHSGLYSGLGLHSGLEFKAARSDNEAQQAMKNGSTQSLPASAADAVKCSGADARAGKAVIIHGSEDTVVNPVNAKRAVTQITIMNDLLDDGAENGSQSLRPISTATNVVPNGYRYITDDYGSANGLVHIRQVSVLGMKHAWSGAHRQGQYADPKGPDAAEIIWNFLSGNQ